MAKIGRVNFRHEQQWGDYNIMYSSKDKIFYADASKLFSNSGEFFDSLYNSEQKVEGLSMEQANFGRSAGVKKIFSKTEQGLVDSVSIFHKMFVTMATSEEKVILYFFDYKTETQARGSKDRYHGGQPTRQAVSMEFKYRIANKKTMGDNKIYTDLDDRRRIDRYDMSNFKEIAWSQELEDFIKVFSKSFDGLVDKMKPFFEVDGKIMELIGKNILTS